MSLSDTFKELVKQEKSFRETEFLAPSVNNGQIQVRIAGVVVKFTAPAFSGFGIWKTVSHNTVRLVREASIIEKTRYLDLFPTFSFIITDVENSRGVLVYNDGRLNVKGEIPILFADNLQQLDCVIVAFDGRNFLYKEHNYRFPQRTIDELKNCLSNDIAPNKIPLVGLTDGIKEGYKVIWDRKIAELRQRDEYKVESAITRAGGRYLRHTKRQDGYSVTYSVDGQEYTSTVNNDLGVISAGICLSGDDDFFDLQTLVTTVREGQNRHQIVRGDYRETYAYRRRNR